MELSSQVPRAIHSDVDLQDGGRSAQNLPAQEGGASHVPTNVSCRITASARLHRTHMEFGMNTGSRSGCVPLGVSSYYSRTRPRVDW
jgi:hypothetical protein